MTDGPQIGSGAFDQHGRPASTRSRVIDRATPTLRCLPLTAGRQSVSHPFGSGDSVPEVD